MRKIIYPLFVFVFLLGLVSCSETSEASMTVKNSKEKKSESDKIIVDKVAKIKTITWDEAKKYKKLKEKDFLAHELFNKPDKTKIDTTHFETIHTYYYKKKLDTGYEKRDWYFSFTQGTCFSHGWAMNTFK
ncbi:MAG: hypothetical protein P8I93_02845 [Crocinitomicaceae bacterium]|nr:hypothetical protein [Crocinitomicaceae bacterium]